MSQEGYAQRRPLLQTTGSIGSPTKLTSQREEGIMTDTVSGDEHVVSENEAQRAILGRGGKVAMLERCSTCGAPLMTLGEWNAANDDNDAVMDPTRCPSRFAPSQHCLEYEKTRSGPRGLETAEARAANQPFILVKSGVSDPISKGGDHCA